MIFETFFFFHILYILYIFHLSPGLVVWHWFNLFFLPAPPPPHFLTVRPTFEDNASCIFHMASFFNLHFIARKINVCKTKLHGFVTKNYYFQISFARVERQSLSSKDYDDTTNDFPSYSNIIIMRYYNDSSTRPNVHDLW